MWVFFLHIGSKKVIMLISKLKIANDYLKYNPHILTNTLKVHVAQI